MNPDTISIPALFLTVAALMALAVVFAVVSHLARRIASRGRRYLTIDDGRAFGGDTDE